MLDLDALEAKAGAATPGPWEVQAWCIYETGDKHTGPVVACACSREIPWKEADKQHIAAASPDVVLALIERIRVAEAEAGVSEQALLLLVTTWCGKVGMCECCHVIADCPEAENAHVLEGPSAIAGSEHLRAWAIRAARRSLGLPEVGACG